MTIADAAAQFEEGIKLLADPAAAGDWQNAVGKIEAAAAAGHAEACERCALFECMGVGRRPDWENGLDWLAKAAELGSNSARKQLILLADDMVGSDNAGHGPGFWRQARARVPLEQKLQAPAGRTLSTMPLIRAVDGFASAAECRWLIESAEPRLDRAMVHYSAGGQAGADDERTNTSAQFQIADMDVIAEMIRARLCAAIGAAPPFLEVSQVLHYAVRQEFKPHYDFLDPAGPGFQAEVARNGQRAVTFLIYLNEDFDGGETRFPRIGLDYRGKTGDALWFSNLDRTGQPEPTSLHAGLPPSRGEKWIFSQWVRDRPLGSGT